ncbi:abortive phage resistance protein [Bacillus subtilis]|uniref:abortive infection family protein n=1 Tax=Bacillus subtilis TaxID=1423 RepID=UPI000F074AD1|nr:abortive infection family protein [Bacillus subtilis]MCV2514754.1 abortive infection family protein [Bacillus subtilis]RNA71952.1 abortive phage resistance protein [Bacillus subtilis]
MLNKHTVHTFYDLLSSYGTLASIQKLFECEDIFETELYESTLSGQRRSLADSYVSTLDLSKSNDLRKLFNVIEMFYLENEENDYFLNDSLWKQFLKLLERDGYSFDNGKIKYENTKFIPSEIEEIAGQYNIEQVEIDWQRALNQAKTDPEDAITATRAMVESTLKWILDDTGEEYKDSENLNQIYKKVANLLKLSPDQHGEEMFKQILGSINGVVTGLGALRNAYGDSHGKGKVYYKPSERHAKFAINLSGTLCIYLLETYMASRKSQVII